jgi:hypothetical protein
MEEGLGGFFPEFVPFDVDVDVLVIVDELVNFEFKSISFIIK